ncbi:MinD/ParA family protein [Ornithinibacillus halotolerans]|uniref:Flagellum site-determining protein YlxH n=1 Tax=Ornithinibacillus halotolerans TaxID=1274357 RepID=A0A916RNF4_9BACI|nr:MinD/ParA family protein [Ornithinibacillus halotolerans]GGA62907.1 flagellum site-determining protein YlxH [Ornithinibacillus halotolerans]
MIHDQAAGLRRTLERNQKQAKAISFVSGKGGVGKSHIAVNFSLELCKQGQKVLLIDLDIGMGNIEILLGLHAKRTIVDMLNDELSVYDIIELGPNKLHYIAGGTGLTSLFSIDERKMNYFLQQFHIVAQEYDYIIFDMGAGASQSSIDFILASDECIVVTTPEPTAITDAYSMIKYIIRYEKTMPIYVVMNRTENIKKGLITINQFKKMISKFLHVEVKFLGVLPEDKAVSSAVIHQSPFSLERNKSPIARSIVQLTENYSNRHEGFNLKDTTTFVERLRGLINNKGR